MKLGLKKPIIEDDIYDCSTNQRSKKSFKKFKDIWSDELKRDKPKLVKTISKFCAMRIFLIGVPIAILELVFK